jgi:cation diffusion facilitator family transporter
MKEKIALISILANIFLASGKLLVGYFSGSVAILAEGIHSLMDIFSSLISYLGIKIAKKPSDRRHPYGHYKYEVLAGAVITIILFATGIGIIYESYNSLKSPGELSLSYLAFGVMIISAIINEIMARYKISAGKKYNSISLLSDGIHSKVDVYTSLAVAVGLILSRYWLSADSILAIIIGIYIIKESFSIGKEAIDSLLDISAGPEIEKEIKKIAQEKNIEISDIKTQKKGSAVTANIEIVLAKNLSVEAAEKISTNLREKLIKKIESLEYVVIQIMSHDVETAYFKPQYGRGFGWQKRGQHVGEIPQASGRGPDGNCICEKCGYSIPHQRGLPCASLKCPKCNINLTRK